MTTPNPEPPRKRRVRYSGTHPSHFHEKYKELNPENYPDDIKKVIAKGNTPAGMHRSICVSEILEILKPEPGQVGLDATLGFGGHAQALLSRIRPEGRLVGIDVDPIELSRTEQRLRSLGFTENELMVKQLNFAGIPKILDAIGGGFDFILADLGISSMQLDNPERGFTYKRNGPLDLRLNPHRGQPASAFIQTVSEEKLEKILRVYSDEPHSRILAHSIYQNRQDISTTTDLTKVIETALKKEKNDITRSIRRTFQALRIAVNDEFTALEQFLRNLPYCLKPKGRVALLSFHSGEDKRVEQFFKQGFEAGLYTALKEPIRPTSQERYDNPRSKSAVLRWAIRSETLNSSI